VDHSGVRLGENLPENISKALTACNLVAIVLPKNGFAF
jgi:hypothetical protein